MSSYLLGRITDPLLGVATGFLAFWLNEHNDQTAPPRGWSLYELVDWKYPREERKKAMGAVGAALPTLPKRDAGSKDEDGKMEAGLAEMLREAGYDVKERK